MAHEHSHEHHGTKNISIAFFLNLFFAIIELAGGLYTNSISITSDALHDFGDSLSLGMSWYFQKKAQKKRDDKYTYGYGRFSLLGAFINSIILTTGSIFIIKESIDRFMAPQQPDTRGMVILALIGIAVNAAAMLRLKAGKSLNERILALHFLEDVLGWLAVLLGAFVMMFVDVPVLDPILSICIAAFILFNVYRNIKASLQIVLQGSPENIHQSEIEKTVLGFKEVKNIHDLHLWTLDGQYNILTLHVTVGDGNTLAEIEELKHNIKSQLKALQIQHTTLEVETESTFCEQVM